MYTYAVTIPVAGYMVVEVEASSKEEAINEAMLRNDAIGDYLEELDTYRHLTQGNVLYAPFNSAYAQEI